MTTPPDSARDLDRLRADIERVDRDLVRLIAKRVELARQVGAVKQAAGLPALDPAREAEVVRRAGEVARDEGVPEIEVRDLFLHIIGMSRRAQIANE